MPSGLPRCASVTRWARWRTKRVQFNSPCSAMCASTCRNAGERRRPAVSIAAANPNHRRWRPLTLYLGIGEHLPGLWRVGIHAEHAVMFCPAEDELGPERKLVRLRLGIGLEAGVSANSERTRARAARTSEPVNAAIPRRANLFQPASRLLVDRGGDTGEGRLGGMEGRDGRRWRWGRQTRADSTGATRTRPHRTRRLT